MVTRRLPRASLPASRVADPAGAPGGRPGDARRGGPCMTRLGPPLPRSLRHLAALTLVPLLVAGCVAAPAAPTPSAAPQAAAPATSAPTAAAPTAATVPTA